MRMIFQRTRPRMQDRHNAERAADPLAVVGEGLDRRRRFAKQRGVHDLLVCARGRAQLLR